MRGEVTNPRCEAVFSWFATRQAGNVARRQLLAAGVPRGILDRRLASGYLLPAHQGVYRVAHLAPCPLAKEFAAALACGPGPLVSHRSAAMAYELLEYPVRGVVWLVSTGRRGDGVRGVRVQQTRRMPPEDVGFLGWLPLTSPARTLLDLGAVVEPGRLETAVARAQARSLVTEAALWEQLLRSRGCRGAAALRELLERHRPPANALSEAEGMILQLIRGAGLPEPLVNARLGRWRPDFWWPQHLVVAEYDSAAFHTDIRSFRRDREKSNELQLSGITVLRFTWHELTRTPEALTAKLRQALSRGFEDSPRHAW
jgi:very-short-patch-repair endonuclease